MADKTFKLIELVGESDESIQQAVRNAIKRAGKTIKGMSWFEVIDVRGSVDGGEVTKFQVTIKAGFRILDDTELTKP